MTISYNTLCIFAVNFYQTPIEARKTGGAVRFFFKFSLHDTFVSFSAVIYGGP